MRYAILSLALALAGCAVAAPEFSKAGASAEDKTRQQAACRMEARKIGNNENDAFVALGLKERQFEDCMVAAGWEPN